MGDEGIHWKSYSKQRMLPNIQKQVKRSQLIMEKIKTKIWNNLNLGWYDLPKRKHKYLKVILVVNVKVEEF